MQQCKPISIVVEGRNGVDWVVVAVENIKAIPFTNTCAEKDHVSGMAMAWNTHDICICLITSQNYKNTYMDNIQRLWYKLITPSILKKKIQF